MPLEKLVNLWLASSVEIYVKTEYIDITKCKAYIETLFLYIYIQT